MKKVYPSMEGLTPRGKKEPSSLSSLCERSTSYPRTAG